MKDLLNSRKLIVTLVIILIGAVFTWFEKLTPNLVELLTWVGGLYLGFNVSQKAAQQWSARKPDTPKEGT